MTLGGWIWFFLWTSVLVVIASLEINRAWKKGYERGQIDGVIAGRRAEREAERGRR